MSNALPSYMYKNPQQVLEDKQEREVRLLCIGCVHGFKMEFEGSTVNGCDKGRRFGRRCELYEVQK